MKKPSIGRRAKQRKGSVLALMAFTLPMLAILAAFCVNAAQMQLTRTELYVATDAAAKAGGRAFSETQDVDAAVEAARITAALNNVDSQPLQIRTGDAAGEIQFGRTEQPDGINGRYEFIPIPTGNVRSGDEIASAVRIQGLRNQSGISGNVNLIIPGLLSKSEFGTQANAVAMQIDRDISLIVDRSGSMAWRDWNWPWGSSPWYSSTMNAGVSAGLLRRSRWGGYYYNWGVTQDQYEVWAWEDHYGYGPAPPSRWEELNTAVDAFLDVLENTSQEEQVSLASYSSYASLDAWLEKDHQIIRNKLNTLGPNGATAIGYGMQQGIQALLDSAARPYASKTMVVMTDGQHNSGIDPVSVAHSLMSQYNLTIHTVTFSSGADISRMSQVATIGGGNHYHAATGEDLIAIFEEIANNLPTILVE